MRRWTLILASSSNNASVENWLSSANALAAPALVSSVAARAGEDRKGRGDLIWALTLRADAAPTGVGEVAALLERGGPVQVVDEVRVEAIARRMVPMAGPRVLRTLLIRVSPDAPLDRVAGLEAALVAMPDHIEAIRSWTLGRLDPSQHDHGWTHLWEQEFADASGFRPYMGHPFHWTGVERWFDPEIPGHIVEDEAHYLSPAPDAILID